jgi:hypothetical protein
MKVDWLEMKIPAVQRKGYGSSSLPISTLVSDEFLPDRAKGRVRPAVVYFYRMNEATEAIETKAFGDERVGVASKLFHFIMINADEIQAEADRKAYAPDQARVYFLSSNGKTLKHLEG